MEVSRRPGNLFLHQCLEKSDFMAFSAELPKTANLFVRDEGGRTVMDLAMQKTAELFQACLSTSFAIDRGALGRMTMCSCAVCAHKRHQRMQNCQGSSETAYSCKNPMRVRYNVAYRNMYIQPKHMRVSRRTELYYPSSDKAFKYVPCEFPAAADMAVSREQLQAAQSSSPDGSRGLFPLPSGEFAAIPGDTVPHQYTYPADAESDDAQDVARSIALEQVRMENQMIQNELLILVDDLCDSPMCDAMKGRLRRLLKKLRSLLLVMRRLGSCTMLRIKATESAVETGLLQQKITFPFLYTALLHRAFKQYPSAPSGQPFDPMNPADGRRLIQLLVNYQLPGFELALFMGNVLSLFSEFVHFFAQDNVRIWRPCKEVQQFYMHMAFSLDSVHLFTFLVNNGQLFSGPADIFKWEDLLYVLMEHRNKFRPYFAALLSSRLKSRVQKRLVQSDAQYAPETVKYPCEERLLTHKVLSEYGSLFGKEEARELNELIRHWKLGVARPAPQAGADAASRQRLAASAPQAFWAE